MVAADQINARSIMVMKSNQSKFFNLSWPFQGSTVTPTSSLTISPRKTSCTRCVMGKIILEMFVRIKSLLRYELSPSAAANFTRRDLADYIRVFLQQQ